MDTLVRRVASSFVRACRHTCIDFDDLMQVGRLAYWHAEQSFDGRGHFPSYAGQQIRRRILDEFRDISPLTRHHHRAIKAGEAPFVALVPVELAYEQPSSENLEEIVERRLRRRRLDKAILQLPPAQRETVTLVLEGRSQAEIAAARGVTPCAISQQLSRAVSSLRRSLRRDAA